MSQTGGGCKQKALSSITARARSREGVSPHALWQVLVPMCQPLLLLLPAVSWAGPGPTWHHQGRRCSQEELLPKAGAGGVFRTGCILVLRFRTKRQQGTDRGLLGIPQWGQVLPCRPQPFPSLCRAHLVPFLSQTRAAISPGSPVSREKWSLETTSGCWVLLGRRRV